MASEVSLMSKAPVSELGGQAGPRSTTVGA